MRRREFLSIASSAIVTWPIAGLAQTPPNPRVIAWLSGLTRTSSQPFADSFLAGMRDLGYVEGRNFNMIYRFSDGFQDRLPALAEEIVQLQPAVILATAVVTAVAARKATSTIPIVSPALADAVHLGLVASRARPGSNVTGIEPYVEGLPAKQMEFAREIVQGATRIGVLTDLKDPKAPPQMQELQAAGRDLKVDVIDAGVRQPDEIDSALQSLANQRVDIVIVLQTSMLLGERRQIAALALAKRLPTIFGYREHILAGGLLSYGVDLRWCFQRGAYFVDKILHGTPAGDLPIEFPTKMFLAINVKTAKALGVTPSATLLSRADEVIE